MQHVLLGNTTQTANGVTIRPGPSLDLNFAASLNTIDQVSGQNLVTFTRTTSGTYFDNAGVLRSATVNLARFDHDPITLESLGLLVEEARTNLNIYSEQFNNAAWGKSNLAITANSTVAPDGTTTADLAIPSNGSIIPQVYIAVSSTVPVTYSIFAKYGGIRYVRIASAYVASGADAAVFDLIDGTISLTGSAATAKISAVGNGWYLCSVSSSSASNERNINPQNSPSIVLVSQSYNGTSGVYVWGAQLEAGAFPTSYIPTTTAAVTRAADVASVTGINFSSWYRQDEGTLFSAFSIPTSSTTGGARVYSISNSSATTQVWLRLQGGTNRVYEVTDSSTQQAVLSAGAFSAGVLYRGAIALKTNDFGFSENGSTPTVDNSGTLGIVDRMGIGMDASGTAPLNGHIRRLTYYPIRIPNSLLQAITL